MTNLPSPSPQRNAHRQFAENRRQVILQAARAYLERGWKPIPVPTGQKHPKDLSWQLEKITLDNYRSKFQLWHGNVGVQCGSPSNGLCDVDLDCREARAVARYFLPATAAIFGRKSAPASHWLYYSDVHETAKTAVTAFDDPINPTEGSVGAHGVRLIELRTGRNGREGEPIGAQSMFPPSIYPNGETVRWSSGGEPDEPTQIDGGELKSAVAMTAAAALLVRHYPAEGKRHDAALVLGGWLARAGWDEDGIAHFMQAIADTAGDTECHDRVNSAKSAVRLLESGENVPGRLRMCEVFGEAIVKAETKWLSISAASAPWQANGEGEGDDGDGGDGGDGGGKDKKQSDLLVELAEDAELFHNNDDGNGYADIVIDAHRETWAISSKSFKRWLTKRYYEQSKGAAPNHTALSTALATIEAKAQFDGAHRDVALRVAEHDGKIYLDLCDDQWQVVEIDDEGWRLVDNPPVRFIRRKGMKALPLPLEGGKPWTLHKYVNVKARADFILVMAWLVAALNPRGPYPVLDVTGEQGTAKSTLLALLRSLIDPNVTPLRAPPREERDLFIAAGNSLVLCYDNLSWLPDWLSDAYARLSTGGGFATRQLYTDDEERLFTAQRPILLGAIEQVVKRGDLADRIVSLLLEPIDKVKRRRERELWQAFERDRPAILGGLLTAVSRGLRRLPHIKEEDAPRLADFHDWAIACGDGYLWQPGEFKKAYAINRAGVTADVVEAEVVSTAIQMLMRPPCLACRGRGKVGERACVRCNGTGMIAAGDWTGTATELLTKLELLVGQRVASAKSWPGSPSALSNRFNRLANPLRRIGIEVDRGDRKHGGVRAITIKVVGEPEVRETPSPPSPPSPQATVSTGNMCKNNEIQNGDGGDGGDGDMQTSTSAPSPAPSPEPPRVSLGLARRASSLPNRPDSGFNYRLDEQSRRGREQRVVDAQRALAQRWPR